MLKVPLHVSFYIICFVIVFQSQCLIFWALIFLTIYTVEHGAYSIVSYLDLLSLLNFKIDIPCNI